MKKLLLALIIPALAMFSCEEGGPSMKVEKNLSKSRELIYQFNTAGSINGIASISSRQLVEALTDDTELGASDYTITSLTIQSLEVTLLPKAGNSASGLNTTSVITSNNVFAGQPKLLNSEPIGMGAGNNELVNSHLLIEGVDALNTFLKSAIGNQGLNSTLFVQITGNTVPINAKAVADLKLKLTFNLEYWYCQESLMPILLEFIDECDL